LVNETPTHKNTTSRACFTSRFSAGRSLAALIPRSERHVIIAIPTGGIPVAAGLAEELDAPVQIAESDPARPGEPTAGARALSRSRARHDQALDGPGSARSSRGRLRAARDDVYDRRPSPTADVSIEGQDVLLVSDGLLPLSLVLSTVRDIQRHRPRTLSYVAPAVTDEQEQHLRSMQLSGLIVRGRIPAGPGTRLYLHDDIPPLRELLVPASSD
jgi:putative phosphoribosyl transferase